MENPHKNHRARLRARFLSSGLSDFAPHNVLELLLFFSLPRRDTNPLAHALLARFGNVDTVLQKTAEELSAVDGIGEATVRFFDAFLAVSRAALAPRRKGIRLATAALLGSYFDALLADAGDGEAAVLYLDNDLALINARRVGCSAHSNRLSPAGFVEEALLLHAPIVAFAHKHADGLGLPLAEDFDLSRLLRNSLEAAGVSFLEHFLVGGGHYTTLLHRHSGECRAEVETAYEGREEEQMLLSRLLASARLPEKSESLLDAYGSLYAMASASYARHRYLGTDERTATLLLLIGAVHMYRVGERPVPPPNDPSALAAYLSDLFRLLDEERLIALFFDRKGKHTGTHTLSSGSVGEAPFSVRRLTEAALFSGAARGVLAHNHPSGRAEPSEEDRAVTDLAREALLGVGVELSCHYIVAEDGVFPIL